MCPGERRSNAGTGGFELIADGGRRRSGEEECGGCGNVIDASKTYCPHCGTHERDRGSSADDGERGGRDDADGGGSNGSSRRRATATRRRESSNDRDGSGGRTSEGAAGRERRGREQRRRGEDRSDRRVHDEGDRGDRGERPARGTDRGDGRGDRGGARTDEERRAREQDHDASSRDNRSTHGNHTPDRPSDDSRRGDRAGGGGGGRRTPAADEEFCTACGEIIDASAAACPACGDQREPSSPVAESTGGTGVRESTSGTGVRESTSGTGVRESTSGTGVRESTWSGGTSGGGSLSMGAAAGGGVQGSLQRLDAVATTMDNRWRVPIVGVDVGVDPLIGLIPGVGDMIAMAISAWIVLRGVLLGAPNAVLAKMTGALVVEGLIGYVPVVGDVIDFFWCINANNVNRLKANSDQLTGSTNYGFLVLGFVVPMLVVVAVAGFAVLWVLSVLGVA
jgi:predicted RNA-binding Zn-ribbon protein involved in translation (DUF1610 family)